MTAAFKKRRVDTSRIAHEARKVLRKPEDNASLDVYQVGRVYDVPINRIRPNPLNSRELYPEVAARQLEASLLDKGQNVAALGFLDLEGEVILIDGLRRLQAVQAIGWRTLRVEIRPLPKSEADLYLASRSANHDREDQTPLDDAFAWKRVLARKAFATQATLSKALGVDASVVSRTLKLAELPPSVIQVLAQHPKMLNFKVLNALREYFETAGEERTLVMAVSAVAEGLSYRDIEARRKRLSDKPTARGQVFSRQIEAWGSKGTIKTFGNKGRLEITVPNAPEDSLEKLAAAVEKLLADPAWHR